MTGRSSLCPSQVEFCHGLAEPNMSAKRATCTCTIMLTRFRCGSAVTTPRCGWRYGNDFLKSTEK